MRTNGTIRSLVFDAPIKVISEASTARFWMKVDKAPGQGPKGDCWQWAAGRLPKGYGSIRIAKRSYLAHRASWLINCGLIPDGLRVLHHCDNPPCVNPDHLFLGTALDNSNDMLAKGREASGDKNGARKYPERIKNSPAYIANRPRGSKVNTAKLNESQIAAIREDRSKGMTQRAVAEKYGISKGMIYYIDKQMSWRHV